MMPAAPKQLGLFALLISGASGFRLVNQQRHSAGQVQESVVQINGKARDASQGTAQRTLLKLEIDNKISGVDARFKTLYISRGSSACWGTPGVAPQPDGSWNLVPDESNHACSRDPDYYSAQIIGLNLGYSWDFNNVWQEKVVDIKVQGDGRNESGTISWTYSCFPLSNEGSRFRGSCTKADDGSFKVTVEAASASSLLEARDASQGIAQRTLLKLEIDNKISGFDASFKTLYTSRGSSACWGTPGMAPQPDGSWNLVPDESNHACSRDPDYYSAQIIGLGLGYSWDFNNAFWEKVVDIKVQGDGRNESGTISWTYSCFPLSNEGSRFKGSCTTADDGSFKVTVEVASASSLLEAGLRAPIDNMGRKAWGLEAEAGCHEECGLIGSCGKAMCSGCPICR